MNVYRLIAIALVFALATTTATAAPAENPPGFDAAFGGESAFLALHRGDTGTLQVFFANTGSTSWAKGAATEVSLGICVDTPAPQFYRCNVLSPYADWAVNWTSARIYATQNQVLISPGTVGTFIYSVKVPADAAFGDYYFRGELIHRATATPIHPVGYYQLVTVVP